MSFTNLRLAERVIIAADFVPLSSSSSSASVNVPGLPLVVVSIAVPKQGKKVPGSANQGGRKEGREKKATMM